MSRRARQIDEIAKLLNRIEAALVVQNPGTIYAAEAFDGLRKTLLNAAKSRRAHISHLITLKDSIDRGASVELLGERVNDFLTELGVQFITDVSRTEHFIFDCDEHGPECVSPAVIDVGADGTEVTIREGHARRPVAAPTPSPAASDDNGSAPPAEPPIETSDPDTTDTEPNSDQSEEQTP